MSNLQIKEQIFAPQDYQKPQLDFDDIWAAMQTRIKIRIHKSVTDRGLDFCTYEDFSTDGDEHYIVDFPFVENEYYYNILLNFGDKCACLEPLHIRAEIKRRIHDIHPKAVAISARRKVYVFHFTADNVRAVRARMNASLRSESVQQCYIFTKVKKKRT